MPKWDVNFDVRVDALNPEVLRLIERAHALAAVIRDIPIPPGVQLRLDALNILRAVRGTTGIEGTELAIEEVRRIVETRPPQRVLSATRQREEQEVRNADRVMHFIEDRLRRNPAERLSEELICQIHELTTQNIDYQHNVPGQYRSHPVAAGDYIPPASQEEIRRLMREFIRWFHEGPPREWGAVVRSIAAHFFVISIHPFGDGNGITSRAVESFLLYQAKVNARGFYSLANFYYVKRPEYVSLLDYVRFHTNGDLTPFVLFALGGLVSELEEVHREVLNEVRLISFRDFARETLLTHGKLGARPGERMFLFLLSLSPEPISLKDLRNGADPRSRLYRGVTARTLARDISFLSQNELIAVDGDQLRAKLEVMDRYKSPVDVEPGVRVPRRRRLVRKQVRRASR